MFVDILGCIAVLVLIWLAGYVFWSAVDFIRETPKQLKRIADALEKRAKDGK